MAVNGQDPGLTSTLAVMVLKMQDKRVLVFHKEGFQLPSFKCWEMVQNTNKFLYFLKIIQYHKWWQ